MICVTLFCTLSKSENTRTCENHTRNMQKHASKSDTSGHWPLGHQQQWAALSLNKPYPFLCKHGVCLHKNADTQAHSARFNPARNHTLAHLQQGPSLPGDEKQRLQGDSVGLAWPRWPNQRWVTGAHSHGRQAWYQWLHGQIKVVFFHLIVFCKLTGFSPQIDLIFPSSISKWCLKGLGLGFRAEILWVG